MTSSTSKSQNKAFFYIFILFTITQVIGLYTGITITNVTQTHPELEQSFNIAPAPRGDIFNTLFLFMGIITGAGIMLLLIKFYKGKLLYKILEFFVVSGGSATVLFSFLLFLGIENAVILGTLGGLIMSIIRFLREETVVRNTAAVMASAGIGAIFGYSIGLMPAIILSIVLIFYDIFAVFIAKYMITFAKHFSAKNLSFSIVATAGKEKKITIPVKEAKEYGVKVSKKELLSGEKHLKIREVHLELGTGDLTVPLMLSVAGYQAFGMMGAVIISLGAILGIIITLREIAKKQRFLPGLPYILTPCLIVIFILFILSVL